MRVVITGATGGIGFAVAETFAQAGHEVVLADLNEAALQEKTALLTTAGWQAHYCVLDVTNAQQFSDCATRFPADILINNTRTQHVARLEDFPPEQWRLVKAFNDLASFYDSQH